MTIELAVARGCADGNLLAPDGAVDGMDVPIDDPCVDGILCVASNGKCGNVLRGDHGGVAHSSGNGGNQCMDAYSGGGGLRGHKRDHGDMDVQWDVMAMNQIVESDEEGVDLFDEGRASVSQSQCGAAHGSA